MAKGRDKPKPEKRKPKQPSKKGPQTQTVEDVVRRQEAERKQPA